MKILDNIATKIADKINAKNDEVMLLTQENERLQREYDASLVAIADREKRIKLCEAVVEQSAEDYDKLENETKEMLSKYQIKTSDYNQLNNDYKRIKNNYDELSKKKPDKKLKQRIKELEEQLDQSEKMRKLNYSLSEAKSFVADKKNKDKLIECLSHNLKLYADENELTFSELGEAYEVSKETARRIYSGERGTSVTTFELMESDMCAYFDCMPLDLVTKKVEGKEC